MKQKRCDLPPCFSHNLPSLQKTKLDATTKPTNAAKKNTRQTYIDTNTHPHAHTHTEDVHVDNVARYDTVELKTKKKEKKNGEENKGT